VHAKKNQGGLVARVTGYRYPIENRIRLNNGVREVEIYDMAV
jgi:hypothetical protein